MVGAGADRVFDTIRGHAIDCDAEQAGWMHVAHSAPMLQVLGARAEAWQRLGRPVRLLDERAARALTGTRHCHGALFDPSGGTLHPLNYAYGLARLAIAAACVVHENAGVDAVQRQGQDWQLRIGAHTLHAEQVLLCTHAAELGVARSLSRVLLPLRVVQLATRPLTRDVVQRISPQRTPVADTRANLFTYRLDRDDRLISGAMPMLGLGAEGRLGPMIAQRLQAELQLPELPAVDCVWQGNAAMTTDFLPHLYEWGPGFIGGIGCNGRGIALTAMLGEVLADAASGRRCDELPVTKAALTPLPLRALAGAATAAAIAQARWQDWRQGL
jgi:glycine/D-amino acid oxidase-like deaminating enzyme